MKEPAAWPLGLSGRDYSLENISIALCLIKSSAPRNRVAAGCGALFMSRGVVMDRLITIARTSWTAGNVNLQEVWGCAAAERAIGGCRCGGRCLIFIPPRPRTATWNPPSTGMSDLQVIRESIPGLASRDIKSGGCRSTFCDSGESPILKSNKSLPFSLSP
jgi:hypothetical protein